MAEMQRYALVNSQGLSENVILWDGVTSFAPPEGLELVSAETPEGQAAIAAAEEAAHAQQVADRAAAEAAN